MHSIENDIKLTVLMKVVQSNYHFQERKSHISFREIRIVLFIFFGVLISDYTKIIIKYSKI